MKLYNLFMKLKPVKNLLLKLPYVPFKDSVKNAVLRNNRRKILLEKFKKEWKQ